jgi:hypothetical protein
MFSLKSVNHQVEQYIVPHMTKENPEVAAGVEKRVFVQEGGYLLWRSSTESYALAFFSQHCWSVIQLSCGVRNVAFEL